jgi:hypothetical protein
MPFSEAADNPKISQPAPPARWTYLPVSPHASAGAGTLMHRAILCLHKRTSGARSVTNQGPDTRMHSCWRRKEASRRRHRAYGLLAAVVESEGQLSSVGCQVLSGL